MSFWIGFFKEAGIPAGDAANYAVTFSDNRITRSMLLDLNKEYLNDMGITILGDVIAILKHSKTVFNQDVRDRALRDTSAMQETPQLIKRSTPASRTLGHYLAKAERSASPLMPAATSKLSKEMALRLGSPIKPDAAGTVLYSSSPMISVTPSNRKVFTDFETDFKVNVPVKSSGETKKKLLKQRQLAELQRIQVEEEKKKTASGKTSVFERLGSEKKTTYVDLDSTSTTQPSIFARLGGKSPIKRAATSTVTFGDDDDAEETEVGLPLEYAGVLKEPAAKKKKLVAMKKPKIQEKLQGPKKVLDIQTDGVLARPTVPTTSDIRSRLGARSTTAEVTSTTAAQPAVKVNTSTKNNKGTIIARTGGAKQLDSITITVKTTPKSNMAKKRVGSSENESSTLDTTSPASSAANMSQAAGVFARLGKLKS
ncbi:hypothetical protein DPMN_095995 [Dreissena polymorpha]|uniref:SAM domain-containing protein n=2 Tax=Dreissena polymorpha TaxID=45954 RepID=A0A9D4R398_DREPO|nr:hypothetical protein DPMN_095995 [Dreissena polymorpha]